MTALLLGKTTPNLAPCGEEDVGIKRASYRQCLQTDSDKVSYCVLSY